MKVTTIDVELQPSRAPSQERDSLFRGDGIASEINSKPTPARAGITDEVVAHHAPLAKEIDALPDAYRTTLLSQAAGSSAVMKQLVLQKYDKIIKARREDTTSFSYWACRGQGQSFHSRRRRPQALQSTRTRLGNRSRYQQEPVHGKPFYQEAKCGRTCNRHIQDHTYVDGQSWTSHGSPNHGS